MTMMVETTPDGWVRLSGYTHGSGGLNPNGCIFVIRRGDVKFTYRLGTDGPVTPTELCACWTVYERVNAHYCGKGEKVVYGMLATTANEP